MIPKNNCLKCKTTLWDEHQITPSPGDCICCIYCGCINQFDKDLNFITPSTIAKHMEEARGFIQAMIELNIEHVQLILQSNSRHHLMELVTKKLIKKYGKAEALKKVMKYKDGWFSK